MNKTSFIKVRGIYNYIHFFISNLNIKCLFAEILIIGFACYLIVRDKNKSNIGNNFLK